MTPRIASYLLISLAVGCNGPKPAPQAPPPPSVTVANPVSQSVQMYHEYNGYLDAVNRVQVRPQVSGFLNKVHFIEGADVVGGETVLYSIDPRDYQSEVAKAEADIAKANADVASADAQIKLGTADVERIKRAGAGASPSDFDKAVATLAASEAQRKSAKANIQAGEAALDTARRNLERTTIKAEISGQIGQTLITQGNLVQAGTTLLTTIVQMDELFVKFDVPEKNFIEYSKSPAGMIRAEERSVPVEVGVATDVGYPHQGRIDFRDNQVTTATGTITIRGRLQNPKREGGKPPLLYSGLYAKVRVPIGEKQHLPVIPEEALLTGQEGRYVLVLGENNVVQKRNVTVLPEPVWKTGPATTPPTPGWTIAEDGGANPKPLQSMVAISKGLTPQDRVIVNGVVVQKVRPGEPAAPEFRMLKAPPAPK